MVGTVAPLPESFEGVATTQVEAATTKYAPTVNLNMRTGASTKYKRITTIPKGKAVSYVGKKGSWYKVKYGSKTGYVSSKYLKKLSSSSTAKKASTSTSTSKYKTTANLSLRTGASTKYKRLTTIPKGKTVSYVGKKGSWYKVKYGSKTGYSSSKYLKKISTSSVKTVSAPKTAVLGTSVYTKYTTTAALNMRTGASTKYKRVTTIPKGKAVSYLGKKGSWYKVKYGSKTGYVSSKYIKATKVVKTTPAPAPKEVKFSTKKYSTTANLTIRSTYSTKGKALKVIPKGKVVSSNTKVSNWYKVTYGGKTGWVSGSYLKTYKAPTPAPKPVAKDAFLSKASSEKILLSASSTNGGTAKLFEKYASGSYYATLLKSTDKALSARYNVTFVQQDSKKSNYLMVNTQRYRDNKHLQKEGDKSFVVASDSFFGSGKKGSKELLDFIKQNINAKSVTEKKMTFGGNSANVRVDEFSITITFN